MQFYFFHIYIYIGFVCFFYFTYKHWVYSKPEMFPYAIFVEKGVQRTLSYKTNTLRYIMEYVNTKIKANICTKRYLTLHPLSLQFCEVYITLFILYPKVSIDASEWCQTRTNRGRRATLMWARRLDRDGTTRWTLKICTGMDYLHPSQWTLSALISSDLEAYFDVVYLNF